MPLSSKDQQGLTSNTNKQTFANNKKSTTTSPAENISLVIVPEQVAVHPLVLLSIVDHLRRADLAPGRRVLGVLLGQRQGGVVNISNSYALPFEEDPKDPTIFYLDHNYHEAMSELFKKISAREVPVGWYHTGPGLKGDIDLRIDEQVFSRYCPGGPVLLVVDPIAASGQTSVPMDAYVAVEEIHKDGTKTSRSFVHIPCVVEAEEAEEVGVEHLLRDVPHAMTSLLDTSTPSPATIEHLLNARLTSLQSLDKQLAMIQGYLERVDAGHLPMNHSINLAIQEVLSGMPRLDPELLAQANSKLTTGVMIGELIRAVQSLHNCIDNKLAEQGDDTKGETCNNKDAIKAH